MAGRTSRTSSKPPSRDALASLRALLDELPPDEVKAPRVPIDRLAAEALALAATADSVRDALLAKGLAPDHIDHLPVLAHALTLAQADLDAARGPRRGEAELALEAQAFALRSEIVSIARIALRATPEALAELEGAQKAKAADELARGLRDLAAFAARHAAAFAKVKAEPARQVARARELAGALEAEATRRRDAPDGQAGAKGVRDRIATLLIETMAEVRAAGTYAFRKDPRLLTEFRSPYNGEKRGRRARPEPPKLLTRCRRRRTTPRRWRRACLRSPRRPRVRRWGRRSCTRCARRARPSPAP